MAENLENTVSSTCEIGTRTRKGGEESGVRKRIGGRGLFEGRYRVWWIEKGAGWWLG